MDSSRRGNDHVPPPAPGDVDALCEQLAADQGVLLAPGSVFEMPGGYFRLGLGHEGIERGLPALERVFERL